MTKIAGIVVEYNPFHNGHLYHLNQTKTITGCDLLIAVMSGNFVQRGEPALIDKWTRTKAALNAGADLIIELPFALTVQSASQFAKGAVTLLDLAGCTGLVFGSETNDIETLQIMADCPINVDAIKENLKQGYGYPKAVGMVQGSYAPNDILGIAYLKALKETSMKAICIQRTNSYHGEELDHEIASATAIRKAILSGLDVSNYTTMAQDLIPSSLISYALYYPYIRLKLLTTSKEELVDLFMMDEGMENHLVKMAMAYDDFESFITKAVSKRYTKARIQRTLAHLMVHTTKLEMKQLTPLNTIRVLGFNDKGRAHLKTLQENEVKIASRFNQIPLSYRRLEHRSTLVYASVLPIAERNRLVQREIEGPVIKKD
jgi:predicted nucleotidyltransferase